MRCWCGGETKLETRLLPYSETIRCADSEFHDPTADGRPTEIKRLYIAGPMSGYPECNYPTFNEAADELMAAGFEVVNPASYGEGRHYVDFIREDLRMMLDCHGVATLENWWESVGARNEVQVAGILKMPVRSVSAWFERGPS